MAPVKKLHTRLQRRLISLLEASLNHAEYGVDKEVPFRPTSEYEVSVADVAVFSPAQWEQTADDDYFRGVPAIVIEVLSPSHERAQDGRGVKLAAPILAELAARSHALCASSSASEMLQREEICLRHGGQEFWLVDPVRESVKMVRMGGHSSVHDAASVIDSECLGASLRVAEIFSR